MNEVLLAVERLAVRFGGVMAVDGVSFQMEEGSLLGLIGPNGAGKTTLLRLLTGVVAPDAGAVRLMGEDITGLPVHARTRRGLALSQQIVKPLRALTVAENVMLTAGTAKTAGPFKALFNHDRGPERDRAMALLDLVGIADRADRRPAELPLGMLKRLEMARALALKPKLLLLDEPLAGLNSSEAERLADTIKALNAGGQSFILIEHNIGEVLRIAERLIVLDNGRLIADGEPLSVMEKPAVRAAYLGSETDDVAA